MKVLIIYAADPLGQRIGGEDTFLRGLIKNSPPNMDVEYVGVTSDPALRLRRWANVRLGDKNFRFYPIFFEKDENKKKTIPLAIRFGLALQTCKLNYSKRVLFFNRLDTATLFKNVLSPKIVVVHNDIERQIRHRGSETLWNKNPWLYFKLERYIFSFIDQAYTVSQKSLAFYQKEYPFLKDRVAFLPTWVDDAIFSSSGLTKADVRKELGYSEEDAHHKWILFVGRMQDQKAPLRLVDTFRSYAENNSDARLIMVGEGNMKSKVEEHIRRADLRHRVIFLKSMPQEKLVKYYQAADTLLLTSNFEGMPMSVLEALGCGLPVVTTQVGEVQLVVKDGFSGEVVTSFEPKDISMALKTVLDSPNVYSSKNCARSVMAYTPSQVLTPVYEKIREISKSV